MIRHAIGFVALITLAACGLEAGRPCTAVAAPRGVQLRVEPPLAARVDRAELRICWDGACRSPMIALFPATAASPQGCSGSGPDDTCGASVVPTGGLTGFADMLDLPKRPVQVSVVLRSASGKRLLDQRLTVTPKAVFPNGPDCGEAGPQARLTAAGDRLRESP